ncbi:MAG: carboxylating nicotinate-nucleotide diphosphorylase [Clostridia bacterium]|nr:carboxylating nicotinate-nucleotide diphosphorylase [Clostridia bacterium]
MLDKLYIDEIIMKSFKEDMPLGDITTDSIIAKDAVSSAIFIAKENGIVAGLDICNRVFELIDKGIVFKRIINDGDKISKGDTIAEVRGNTRALLKGERTALNILQRLSGIATKTHEYCSRVKDLPAKVTDTRKTVPGLRLMDKYAVRTGGGSNHRFSLSDGVLIKDNHIEAAGSILRAVELARKSIPHTIKIEVETETIVQVREALEAGADIIMLDNMSIGMMKEAVGIISKRAIVEASGNVSLDRIREIAETGVDIISVGELTHSVKALDISMNIE